MTRLAFGCLAITALLLGSAGAAPAWEHGYHGVVGHGFWGPRVFIGPPAFWWDPYPYYPPAVVVAPAPPPRVYVEPPPAPEPAPQQYWYYCENPRGYYPYVSQCPGGWMQVVPRTMPSNP